MSPELKQKLNQQYYVPFFDYLPKKENGTIDWIETIGAPIAVAGIALFGYLWFRYL
ncbi:MAG: hypothetical protein NT155_03570 [Candidatus Staskawiczbacteria bacterium]|nr:hypothetical protein [Candidatus Staskawiczbacteria bacterium]